jgi:hypothetical protein
LIGGDGRARLSGPHRQAYTLKLDLGWHPLGGLIRQFRQGLAG